MSGVMVGLRGVCNESVSADRTELYTGMSFKTHLPPRGVSVK